ncbi:MAG TPA: V-type ATP synthase subunit E family protein [Candidatus Acidoferrum sp.]|nr:V-type ATP synthase subunit E family protein [Candidatus Acidoferrum sp.]
MSANLDKLLEDILKESRAKAEEIKEEGLTQIEDTLSKARADAVREADLIARNTKTECDATVNRRVSQEKQKARLAYLIAKNNVLDEVMNEVQTGLVHFCRDDSRYRALLLKWIMRGMEAVPSDAIMVALSESDLRRYGGSKLLEDTLAKTQTPKTVVLNSESIKTIGGTVVMSRDNKVRVDCTLEARLGLMKTELLAEISRILFAS